MAFFVNPGKDWENNLTEEDIAKLEAQGCDVNGLRNRPSVPEDDEEGEETFDNPTRLDRLKPYLQTPRDMETPFSFIPPVCFPVHGYLLIFVTVSLAAAMELLLIYIRK